jgi:hypothetical protein
MGMKESSTYVDDSLIHGKRLFARKLSAQVNASVSFMVTTYRPGATMFCG